MVTSSALAAAPTTLERERAPQLTFAGTIGNSGMLGSTLVRTTAGRRGGGVAVDGRGRIFAGGGDRVVVLSREGRLLWEVPLPQSEWVLGGPTFAITRTHLYFVAGKPRPYGANTSLLDRPWELTEPNICRVSVRPGSQVEVIADKKVLGWTPNTRGPGPVVTAAPPAVNGTLPERAFVGFVRDADGTADQYVVAEVLDGKLSPCFTLPQGYHRISVDEEGRFYVATGETIDRLLATGSPDASFAGPRPIPDLGPVPTDYLGSTMLTRDLIWDAGIYGFVGRFTRDWRPEPGAVSKWQMPLYHVAQVVDAPSDDTGAALIKSHDAVYRARIVDERLRLERRYGSISTLDSLGLTEAGQIGVGSDGGNFLWFDFDDPNPAAPPIGGDNAGTVAQGFPAYGGYITYALAPPWMTRQRSPRPLDHELKWFVADGSLRQGPDKPPAFKKGKVEARVTGVAKVGDWVFAVDGDTGSLLTARFDDAANLAPAVAVERGSVTGVGSVAGLGGTVLVTAQRNSLAGFSVIPDGRLKPVWQMKGPATDDAFGERLQVAASGAQLLVADTDRHRVVLLSVADAAAARPTHQATFGHADRAGDDAAHLRQPTLVSINGGKAVVYDSGNQRIVRLVLR